MDIGQTAGNIGGTIAGAALLGAIDGPLPFMDVVGAGIGGAIGGDIGKAIGGKGKKRMAGQIDPRLLMMTTNTPMPNPNTQGLGDVMASMQQTHSY
tara:strand:+ start:483 stop:770 length:288 start_codon:yes stop_codon:yes gene_type:complete